MFSEPRSLSGSLSVSVVCLLVACNDSYRDKSVWAFPRGFHPFKNCVPTLGCHMPVRVHVIDCFSQAKQIHHPWCPHKEVIWEQPWDDSVPLTFDACY